MVVVAAVVVVIIIGMVNVVVVEHGKTAGSVSLLHARGQLHRSGGQVIVMQKTSRRQTRKSWKPPKTKGNVNQVGG